MLVIPMWLNIGFYRIPSDDDSFISFRYSPRTKKWWMVDWKNQNTHHPVFDVKTEINTGEDVDDAIKQIRNVYDGAGWRISYRGRVHYWRCILDGSHTHLDSFGFWPNNIYRMPWNRDPDLIPNYGFLTRRELERTSIYRFFHGDQHHSCAMCLLHLDNDSFAIEGVIRERNTNRLIWRRVEGSKCGKNHITERPIYDVRVTGWQFYVGKRNYWSNRIDDRPVTTIYNKETATIKDGMSDDEKYRVALPIFLYPALIL